MNCQDFEKLVLALARNRLLDAAVREQGLHHTEICVRCAARLTEEQALLVGVRAVITEIAHEEAPTHLEATLLTAFREQAAAKALPVLIGGPNSPVPIKTRRSTYWKFGAVAAGILLLLSIALFWMQSNSPQRERETRVAVPAPSIAPEPPAPAPQPASQFIDNTPKTAQRRVPPHRRRTPPQADSSNQTEVVTQFFSLMEGDDLSSLDGNQIVRVEVPGSALLALGLPVDDEIRSRSVKADVVLRHDGLPRAIRFVH